MKRSEHNENKKFSDVKNSKNFIQLEEMIKKREEYNTRINKFILETFNALGFIFIFTFSVIGLLFVLVLSSVGVIESLILSVSIVIVMFAFMNAKRL